MLAPFLLYLISVLKAVLSFCTLGPHSKFSSIKELNPAKKPQYYSISSSRNVPPIKHTGLTQKQNTLNMLLHSGEQILPVRDDITQIIHAHTHIDTHADFGLRVLNCVCGCRNVKPDHQSELLTLYNIKSYFALAVIVTDSLFFTC